MTESTREPTGVSAPGEPADDERAAAAPGSADSSPPANRDPASEPVDFLDYVIPRAEYMRKTPPVWGVSAPPTDAAPRAPAPVGEDVDGGAPPWLVVMMIASAAACTTIIGYYLRRAPIGEPPARGVEPAIIGNAGAPAEPPSASKPAPSPSAAPPTEASPRPATRTRPRSLSTSSVASPLATPPMPHASSTTSPTLPSGRLFGTED